jgi:hypothetical protein
MADQGDLVRHFVFRTRALIKKNCRIRDGLFDGTVGAQCANQKGGPDDACARAVRMQAVNLSVSGR